MGYVVKPGLECWVRVPGDRAVRLMAGDAVPGDLPEAEHQRLERAGLIEPAKKPRPRRAPAKPKE